VTPPGIDPGTVRLAAQRLNHYATLGLHSKPLLLLLSLFMCPTYDGQPQYSRGHVVVLDAQVFLQPQYDLTNNTLHLLYYILDAQLFLRSQ